MQHIGNIVFGPASSKDVDKFFVGADTILDRVQQAQETFAKTIPSYPPFNIKKTDDLHYVIEIACAGFSEEDLDVELDGDKLTIRGDIKEEKTETYIHRGIAKRNFERTFLVSDTIDVESVELDNGMLIISLINKMDPPKKFKIDISNKKQMLTE